MVSILHDVVAWIDPPSAAAIGAQSRVAQNKTLIRVHLGAALKAWSQSSPTASPQDDDAAPDKDAATQLQERVLHYARENADTLQKAVAQQSGTAAEEGIHVERPGYADRFSHDAWAHLLGLVREAVGRPNGQVLRPEWDGGSAGRVLLREGGRKQVVALANTIYEQVLSTLHHVDRSMAQNPVAMTAIERLKPKIQDLISVHMAPMGQRGRQEDDIAYSEEDGPVEEEMPGRDSLPPLGGQNEQQQQQHYGDMLTRQEERTCMASQPPTPQAPTRHGVDSEDHPPLTSALDSPSVSVTAAAAAALVAEGKTAVVVGDEDERAPPLRPQANPRWMSGPRAGLRAGLSGSTTRGSRVGSSGGRKRIR
jgi:hypothetical protein